LDPMLKRRSRMRSLTGAINLNLDEGIIVSAPVVF
jgi:hypothetical protein